ncbi:MAG: AAA family ATPase [Treponema sp.]|nr:AAA family ATPase [Treponema sp.]
MSVKCQKCNRENRDAALFCRFCGDDLSLQKKPVPKVEPKKVPEEDPKYKEIKAEEAEEEPVDDFDYAGLDEIRSKLQKFISLMNMQKIQRQHGLVLEESTTVFVFQGESGTGKTLVANSFIKDLKLSGCLPSTRIIKTDLKKFMKEYPSEEKISAWLRSENPLPGVIFIDDIQNVIDSFHEVLKGLTADSRPVVCILAGTKEPIARFIKDHPEDAKLVTDFYNFPRSEEELLAEILRRKLVASNMKFDQQVEDNLVPCVSEARMHPDCKFQNAWLVEKEIFQKISSNMSSRIQKMPNPAGDDFITVKLEDLAVKNRKLTTEEVLEKLDEMIGLDDVKKAVKQIGNLIQMNKEREKQGIKSKITPIHIVFTGNPGTGKTTVARLLGQLFNSLGLLPTAKFVETDRSGMVAPYVGQTAPLVNKRCDEAMGGILFIDEAYNIVEGGGSFGQESVAALLKRMEDDRGKFVVIAAGYKNEMDDFIKANPGLQSRFTHFIHLPDYNPDELYRLFVLYANSAKYTVEENAVPVIKNYIKELYDNKGKEFANGRTIRNFFDETCRKTASRVSLLPEEQRTVETMTTITLADLPVAKAPESVDEVLAELDDMIGMEEVKVKVRELAETIMMNKERERKLGTKEKAPAIHIVFTGNPGTGKTTVARILGKLFHVMGLLPTARVVETDRSGMVAPYLGQTAPLVNKRCDEAMGGILFIDEAYSIAEGVGGYGQEAIAALLKRMEDDRGKFVVIAAGYQFEMQDFLSANPGFESRFTHKIHLKDYNPDELMQLFELYAQKGNCNLTAQARDRAKSVIQNIYDTKDFTFANGRTIRNLYDESIRHMNSRIAKLPEEERTPEVLTTMLDTDIVEKEEM